MGGIALQVILSGLSLRGRSAKKDNVLSHVLAAREMLSGAALESCIYSALICLSVFRSIFNVVRIICHTGDPRNTFVGS